jgi:hypothetical protein
MFEPIDQSRLIAGGMQLVPNLLEQELRKRLIGVQEQQAQTQANQETRLSIGAAREFDEEDRFRADLEGVIISPSAAGYARLMTTYPKYAEGMKKGWDALDKDRRDRDLSVMSGMFAAGANDRWDLVERDLQARVDADREAGNLDDADDEMLAMVKSGDPEQRRRALGMMGFHLAAIDGVEKFAPILDKLTPITQGQPFEQYARAQGLKPGTAEYRAALQDYVLRGQGPTAYENRERMEGVEQGNRVQLEGVRQGGRVALEGVRQGNRVALEGVRQGNRESLVDKRERAKPPSPNSVIGKIMAKVAAGQPLSKGEQKLYDEWQAKQSKGSGRGRGGGAGAVIVNPKTGQRLRLVNGKWVPA